MGVVPTCTGLEDIEGLKGTESMLGITGEIGFTLDFGGSEATGKGCGTSGHAIRREF